MSHTSRFIGPLLHFLFPTTPEETLLIYHGYIRKAAHFTEYCILALFGFRFLSGLTGTLWARYRFILPVLFVALVASIDEFNQSFEPSRTSSLYDVLLDISGGVGAVIMLWLVLSRRSKST